MRSQEARVTLVVGRVTDDIGFLVADTFLSRQFELKHESGPVNGQFHALKIQILNAKTAVAFSGDVAPAFTLIRILRAELEARPTIDVPGRLFDSYKTLIEEANEPPPDCDFLVLQLTLGKRKLTLVTREGIFDRDRAYIGDSAEYRRLMALRRPHHSPKTQTVQQPDGSWKQMPLGQSEGEIEFAVISDAIERLVAGGKAPR
jgi:hypothetical protein